jgi:GTPase SAR1 family protein
MVVLGAPGTGKTTLLRFLIGQRAQQALKDYSAYIPIFISLPDLARSGRTIREYLIYAVQEMMIHELYADVLWKAIVEGQAFICFDSLDEVAPKQRPEKIRLINELAADGCNILVVGSRFRLILEKSEAACFDTQKGLKTSDQRWFAADLLLYHRFWWPSGVDGIGMTVNHLPGALFRSKDTGRPQSQ